MDGSTSESVDENNSTNLASDGSLPAAQTSTHASHSGHFKPYVFPKTWRSECYGLVMFGVFIGAGIALSIEFPQSIITGPLFTAFGYSVSFSLPLFWLLPAWKLSLLAFRIYNVHYIADERGLESIDGILSLNQKITRLRYEDVRSLELDQTIIERILNVGELEIGTAGTAGIEMVFDGVSSPFAIKALINERREQSESPEDLMPHSDPTQP